MDLSQFSTTCDFREILRILQGSSSLSQNIFWQSFSDRKNIISVKWIEVDFIAREVVAFIQPGIESVDENIPLYAKLDYHSAIFKITQYQVKNDVISFGFPSEMKLIQ